VSYLAATSGGPARAAAIVLLSLCGILTSRSFAFEPPEGNDPQQQDPQQLIREVISHELSAEQQDQSLWQFEQTSQNHGKTEQFEVVETKQGPLQRLVAINGRPLTAPEAHKQDQRLKEILAHPQTLERQSRQLQRDEQEEQHLLQMLPVAFHYSYAGREGNLIKLDFTPNPSFKPQRREDQVFHHLQGSIWVDPSQKRLARLDGHLTSEVKFGGGILGHLAKGGTFYVEQKDLGNGYWELARLRVNMNGKALLFKTISVVENQTDSNFQPLPQDISLRHAVELLEHASPASTASAAGQQN
jgi:hypothetical protein